MMAFEFTGIGATVLPTGDEFRGLLQELVGTMSFTAIPG